MTADTAPSGHTSPIVPGDLFARHQVITGLRALADFLETNPAVPVPEYGDTFHFSARESDDAASAARVDQVAALLGVPVADDRPTGGHYTASKSFGRITYRIVHVPKRRHDEYDAYMSYRDNIRLDQDDDQDAGRAA
ncbi:hypothetical protein [Actinomadura coerulea]|uniref:hypothetical protein n=1 Tax=Actinomadura coerulea TaxID=46159 RepID=UPI003428711E